MWILFFHHYHYHMCNVIEQPSAESSQLPVFLLNMDLRDGIYLLSFFLLSLSLSLNLALRARLGPSFSVSAGPGALCDNECRFERGSYGYPRPEPIVAQGLPASFLTGFFTSFYTGFLAGDRRYKREIWEEQIIPSWAVYRANVLSIF